jgi:hypothetical protein
MGMTGLRPISFEQARRIASEKGLIPSRVRGTQTIRFAKGENEKLERIEWTEFEQIAQERRLTVYESGGFMKLMRTRESN